MAEPTTTPEMKLPKNSGLFPWWLLLLWGVLALIVGIMFFITPAMTTVLFIMFLGAYWLVGGLFTLGSLAVDRTSIGWKIFLAAINIIAGILILIYPLLTTLILLSFFIICLGIWACFMGCVHLYHAYSAKDAGTAGTRHSQPDLRYPAARVPPRFGRSPSIHRRCLYGGTWYLGNCPVGYGKNGAGSPGTINFPFFKAESLPVPSVLVR